MDTSDGVSLSVPISALEHYEYCRRQAALIHIDAYFDSSVDTVRGDIAHAAVDRGGPTKDRRGDRVWHALPVWSDELRIHGLCDAVHWESDGPVPIEHKSGRYKPGGPADVQVAAQVLCLREMFNTNVPVGVVFSGKDRRRHEVIVDADLTARVKSVVIGMRQLIDEARVPPAVYDARCRRCSLQAGCLPDAPTVAWQTLFVPREEAADE